MQHNTGYTIIAVTSLTYAFKGQKILEENGFKAWPSRDHERKTGCGYQLNVKGDAQKAREILKLHGVKLVEEGKR